MFSLLSSYHRSEVGDHHGGHPVPRTALARNDGSAVINDESIIVHKVNKPNGIHGRTITNGLTRPRSRDK